MIETDTGWLFQALDGRWYMAAFDTWKFDTWMIPVWEVWQVRFEWWMTEPTCYDEEN